MLFLDLQMRIRLHCLKSKLKVILVNDRFFELSASDLVLFAVYYRIVIWEELLYRLIYTLNKLIVNVQHHLRDHFFVKIVLNRRFRGIFRLVCFTFYKGVLTEKLYPVLEAWHDPIRGSPLLKPVRLLKVVRGPLLVVYLVVKYNEQLVAPFIVVSGKVRVLKKSSLEDLPEDILLHVLVIFSLEDVKF